MTADLLSGFPSFSYLAARARRRIPHFAWEFLDSGTGTDRSANRNLEALAEVTLVPQFMRGAFEPDLSTELFGTRYELPFGVAPVGLAGIVWPRSEQVLCRAAAKHRFPYTLSTAASEDLELIGPMADGMGWYQLYPPRNPNIRSDLLARVRDAGFHTLLVTADVPVISRRERQARAGVGATREINLAMLAQSALRPAWSLATLQAGKPRLRCLDRYVDSDDVHNVLSFIGREINGTLDWDYLRELRDEWQGPLVLKGVMSVEQARQAVEIGVDGVLVSNHGGRQLDAAPAAISVLPAIAAAVGDRASVLFDSGVRSGLDVARAIALGADFVLLGRAFMMAVAALGERGGEHAAQLLRTDLEVNMSQLGCATLNELRDRAPAMSASAWVHWPLRTGRRLDLR